jgi:hypothetical protein
MTPEAAVEFLRGDVRRLCAVRFAASALLQVKALAFYSELPAGDGDTVRDAWLDEVRALAGQFPIRLVPGPKLAPVCVPKRAEITEAFQAVMEDAR